MELRCVWRDYARDERGAITFLVLVLFIGIILLTGFALDLAKHESVRADLQSAADRGALAAASLRQSVGEDAATQDEVNEKLTAMIKSYVSTRSLSRDPAEITVSSNITDQVRQIDVSVTSQMPTDFFRMVGVDRLDVSARSQAKEGLGDIEISMVLDTSGSMGNPASKIASLRREASDFVATVMNNNPDGTVTFNVVEYDTHVNVGPWMFDRVARRGDADEEEGDEEGDRDDDDDERGRGRGRPDDDDERGRGRGRPDDDDEEDSDTAAGADGYCYETLIDGDLEDRPGTVPNYPGAGERAQIDDNLQFVYENGSVANGTDYDDMCPPNDSAIGYFEDDLSELTDRLDDLDAGGSTATYLGMQWGLALLNPATRPLVDEMRDAGLVGATARGRPADWTAGTTDKYVILFTDGALNVQLDFYTPNGHPIPSQSRVERVFADQCAFARDQNVVVFTIAFELPSDVPQRMRDLLRDCASDGRFLEADEDNLDVAFRQIAADIQRLKLLN